jgi:fructose-bisphosphate aldolase class II/tagatose 1,6-diphosphate aldolase GatY/KbaY
MFDGSELPFKDNVAITKKVVEMAKPFNANVEAELGYVAKLGQSSEKIAFTTPEDAKIFVDLTGVHALAVAIGTAHGFYKSEPKLDFPRLNAIRHATDAFLVLHGGSGVPDEAIRKAVRLGICKVNIATEIKNMFTLTLKNELINNEEIDLRKTFPPAIKAVKKLIEHKLSLVN